MSLALPNVIINFYSAAVTAISRGDRGIVAIVLTNSDLSGTTLGSNVVKSMKIEDVTGIDAALTANSLTLASGVKEYIERAFIGGINPVKYVQVIVGDTLAHALNTLETIKFDFAVGSPNIASGDVSTFSTAIVGMRTNKEIKVKAVLPNKAADDEGIINFTTDNIVVDGTTYSTAAYCSRIAGLLAGTPLQQSATFYTLSEVDDVPKKTKAELDTAIGAGKFEIYHDGTKVKVARAVNSLQTIGAGKSEDWKSIKIIDIMDLIYMDIKRTCEDSYIGRYPNNYLNKCNLRDAIDAYLRQLRADELIDQDIQVDIDVEAQANWLLSQGVDISDMTEEQIKEANTSTYVWITASYKILNAIEDITVKFYI